MIAAVMQLRTLSFWHYKVYVGIRGGSLERSQTTVGLRVMRTCCGRMLKLFAVYVTNLLAVDFGGDRRKSRSLRR